MCKNAFLDPKNPQKSTDTSKTKNMSSSYLLCLHKIPNQSKKCIEITYGWCHNYTIAMKKHLKANVVSLQSKRVSSRSLKNILRIISSKLFSERGGKKDLRISQDITLCTGKGRETGFAMICQGTPNSEKTI